MALSADGALDLPAPTLRPVGNRPMTTEAAVSATLTAPPAPTDLDGLRACVESLRDLYAEDVRWIAPRRGIEWVGRETVIRNLLREAASMREPRFTPLRRNQCGQQVFDEYAVRFVFDGDGIEGIVLHPGDPVELERLRILTIADGRIAVETCIETWSVLPGDHTRIP